MTISDKVTEFTEALPKAIRADLAARAAVTAAEAAVERAKENSRQAIARHEFLVAGMLADVTSAAQQHDPAAAISAFHRLETKITREACDGETDESRSEIEQLTVALRGAL